jgi:hypothetical protein
MPKYFSMMLSPNMDITAEGYLICKNVPICRSGSQEYYGRELKGFPGYEDSWDLDPETKYSVKRPKEEVLHPDTIASFEGKSVVDEHPENDVVTVDNERDVHCGHLQNVKEGPIFGSDVTLQGDLIIKDSTLIEKIRPDDSSYKDPVRDVSCGYTLKLRRLADKTLEMYYIRGNHVAVVTKGRAGSRIAIGDSAPPEIKPKKGNKMSLHEMIFGRGLKAYAQDASPEELAELSKEMGKGKGRDAAADADSAVDKKVVPGSVSADKDPHRAAAHAALDRAMDAMKDPKGMGNDAFGKAVDAKGLRKEVNKFLGEEEKEPEHQTDSVSELNDAASDSGENDPANDAKEKQNEKTAAEQKDKMVAEDAADSEGSGEKVDDLGKSVLKAANDSVREYIKTSKPIVAGIVAKPRSQRTSQEQMMVDSYNRAVTTVNQVGGRAYSALSKTKIPEGIPALATDSEGFSKAVVIEDTTRFFEGVPYRIGKQRLEAHMAQKGGK